MALVILDVSNLIYRAFYSINPDRFKRSDGLSTNVVYGVASMIIKLIKMFKSDYSNITLVACLDSPTCCQQRKSQQSSYKENRPQAPLQLRHQFKWIREMLSSMDIHHCEVQNYEADDIIASYSKKYEDTFDKIIIVSPDKDMYQLLNKKVCLYNPRKKQIETPDDFHNLYGFPSKQFILYQAIVGDKIDNVAGVKGIGHKNAVSILIESNGDINTLFTTDFKHKKKNLLMSNKDLIQSNINIVTLSTNVQVTLPSSTFNFKQLKTQKFKSFLDEMEIETKSLRQYAAS